MRPTREQIEIVAYNRWLRRSGVHGHDWEDWSAAEKDLVFALNYRYVARYKLGARGPNGAEVVLVGKGESAGGKRRCRFCERAEPSVSFSTPPLALPRLLGDCALVAWDECDECRAHYDAHLAGPFEAFARTILDEDPERPADGIPVAGLKGLVRLALAIMPTGELHHFDDTIEWVANPDHAREAALLGGLGCRVYRTPVPVPVPFLTLARRADGDAPAAAPFPYVLIFLGASRVVIETHLPLCPRDEDLEDAGVLAPELSMSLGQGPNHRASRCTFLPVARPEEPAHAETRSSAPVFEKA